MVLGRGVEHCPLRSIRAEDARESKAVPAEQARTMFLLVLPLNPEPKTLEREA